MGRKPIPFRTKFLIFPNEIVLRVAGVTDRPGAVGRYRLGRPVPRCAKIIGGARKEPVMGGKGCCHFLPAVTGILFTTSLGSPLTATLIVRMPLAYPAVTSSASAPGGSSACCARRRLAAA